MRNTLNVLRISHYYKMKNYSQFLKAGSWQKGNIKLNIVPSSLNLSDEIKSRIDKLWNEKVEEANRLGKLIYNGTHYRLENLRENEGEIIIDISPIEFKTRINLKELVNEYDIPMIGTVNIGGFVEDSEGNFIFGVKGKNTLAQEGAIDFIGGGLEGDVSDIFHQNETEIKEEIGVDISQITSQNLCSIVITPFGNYIFVTHTKLSLNSDEVRESLKNSDGEFSELIFVERENLKQYLKDLGGYKFTIAENLDKLNFN